MKDYIAFFDLDNTIINDSSGKLMGLHALKHGLLQKHKAFEGLLLAIAYKSGLMEGEKIISRLVKWLKDQPEQRVIDFAVQLFQDVIKHTIRKDAVKEIDFHKKQNAQIVILSASMSFLCRPFLQFLGIDDLICTELKTENQKYTGLPKNRFCYGTEKLIRSKQYCSEHKYSLKNAYFYTDSVSDLPMLEAVGNPVIITPDKLLEQTAKERGWPLFNWL